MQNWHKILIILSYSSKFHILWQILHVTLHLQFLTKKSLSSIAILSDFLCVKSFCILVSVQETIH